MFFDFWLILGINFISLIILNNINNDNDINVMIMVLNKQTSTKSVNIFLNNVLFM